MSSPAILPINDTTSSTPMTTPAFRSFLSRLTTSARHTFSQARPWYELIDRTAFSRPENLTDAISRIRKNASYFRVNYLTLISAVLALFLISHIFSLLVLLSLLASWCFLYFFRPSDQPVLLFGRTFSDREMLGILSLLTVIVVFLTSVGSLLISAVLSGLLVVSAHGAFRVPEDLFLDEQEGPNSGLLSFLGGAASSAAVAAASNNVSGRV
ncbi:hypothetical protein BVRB_2g044550 [Beta vulgaris subsp. vulgaris]|uniref:PRA1 family protein n=2 Tax=Beta vulgaris subsp. vulgaris TaxID=3555 RepID=A0A0J8BET8_BETVV|nr:hypothetical protein BVRB_2g044550 [Beta vulgaris subsp. vulgaris]